MATHPVPAEPVSQLRLARHLRPGGPQPGYRDSTLRTLLDTAGAVLGPGGEVSRLQLVDGLGARHIDPPTVIVSNNPYALGDRAHAVRARPSAVAAWE
jgi:hypothetical protein